MCKDNTAVSFATRVTLYSDEASILVGRIRDIRNRHRLEAMPTTPGPGGRVTRNCEERRAETHRGEATHAHLGRYAHVNKYAAVATGSGVRIKCLPVASGCFWLHRVDAGPVRVV